MKVLFANPPWWLKPSIEPRSKRRLFTAGVRAGSRWPFTSFVRSKPDQFIYGDYLPYPFFMGYAATYAQKHTQATILYRDSTGSWIQPPRGKDSVAALPNYISTLINDEHIIFNPSYQRIRYLIEGAIV